MIDQPRRGNAGRSTVPATIPATTDDQIAFGLCRIGVWPDYFPSVQFSRDPEALNQFFRSMTPNTGPFDAELSARAVAVLFDKIGPAILVTHSQGGGPGWLTVIKSSKVRAVVSYEPGSGFVFPESELPVQEIRPGDVVWCPSGVKHWHGAAPTAAMTHIAVTGTADGIGTANQTQIAGAPVRGPLFDFAPVINQFLQAHLFGDIFERDNLDWQSRELATVGALAATPGVESQLRSHMAASLRVGLKDEHLRQLVGVLAAQVNADAGKRASEALTQALATMKAQE